MKKIIVSIPNGDEKWKVSFSGPARKRNTATVVYNAIERHLHARNFKEKTAIVIKEGTNTVNESLPSLDARYLLFTAACFLEDYLLDRVLKDKYKKYENKAS